MKRPTPEASLGRPPHPSGAADTDERVWDVLLVGLCVMTLLAILLYPLNISHDPALYLQCGQLLLEGKLPYVDFVEINPPMIMYLSVVPVFVARLLNLNPVLAFQLFVFLIFLGSVASTRLLLIRSKLGVDRSDIGLLLVIWSLFSFGILVSFQYGQREHLFLLLLLPFFIVRWIRWNDGRLPPLIAILAAVGCGLGAAIKPHFLLIVAAPELYWLASRRTPRRLMAVESVVFVSIIAAYVAHFLFLPSAVREAFFGRWLPFIAEHYSVYDAPIRRVMREPGAIAALALGVIPFVVAPARPKAIWKMAQPLSCIVIAGVLVFLIQSKGWAYHRYPALGAALLIVAIVLAHLRPLSFTRSPNSQEHSDSASPESVFHLIPTLRQSAIVLFAAGIALSSVIITRVVRGEFYPRVMNPIAEVIEEFTEEEDAVLFISTEVNSAYPLLVQLNRRPGSRYLWSFPIPMFYADDASDELVSFPYREGDAIRAEERRFLDELADDVERNQPPLILINDDCQPCPVGFSPIEYLDHSGFLTGPMANYELLDRVAEHAVYILRQEGER